MQVMYVKRKLLNDKQVSWEIGKYSGRLAAFGSISFLFLGYVSKQPGSSTYGRRES